MISPMICTGAGALRSIRAATTAAKRGTAPLIIPANDDEIHCWATGNRYIGTAIQIRAMAPMAGQAARSIFRRAAGNAARVVNPTVKRAAVMNDGVKDSRLSAMRRNEEPQIAATATSRAHSTNPNACR